MSQGETGADRGRNTLRGGGGSGKGEEHHYVPIPPSAPQPAAPPSHRGLRRRVTAALLPRREGAGACRRPLHLPFHPRLGSARRAPLPLRGGQLPPFCDQTRLLRCQYGSQRKRRGGVTWWEGGLQALRGRWREGGLAAPRARARRPLPLSSQRHPPLPPFRHNRPPEAALGGAAPSPPRGWERPGARGSWGGERRRGKESGGEREE